MATIERLDSAGALYYTSKIKEKLDLKQDVISDLAAIRSNASKGANYSYTLSPATTAALGGVQIGSNIGVTAAGVISISSANVTGALGFTPANATHTHGTADINGLTTTIQATKVNSAGYADSAGAVAWSNITSAPTSMAPTAHNHVANNVTAMTGYNKTATSAAAVGATDTLNIAIAKIENVLDGKQDTISDIATIRSNANAVANKADTTALTAHTGDTTVHITSAERTKWNAVSNKADTTALNSHVSNTTVHITTAERTAWSGAVSDLATHTSDTTIHITSAERTAWNAKAPAASPTLTGTAVYETPANAADSVIANVGFVKSQISTALSANDAMIFKGTVTKAADLPATHEAGWTYKVATAGTYVGVKCEIGDMIICVTDGTTANNAHWSVIQTNIDGAVTGPASATSGAVAVFDGTSGKVIKSGITIPSDAVFTDHIYTSGTGITLTGSTFSLNSATSSALGGVKVGSNISVTSGTISITSANVSAALGYAPAGQSVISDTEIDAIFTTVFG